MMSLFRGASSRGVLSVRERGICLRLWAAMVGFGLAGTIVVSLAACGPSAKGDNGATAPIDSDASLSSYSPLDEFLPQTPDGFASLTGSEDAFLSECMAQKGFEYTPAGGGIRFDSDAEMPRQLDMWWGVSEVDAAMRHGYHFIPLEEVVEVIEPKQVRVPPGYDEALSGVQEDGTDGCSAEYQALINEGLMPEAESQAIELEIREGAAQAGRLDPRVSKASGDWAACMRAEGYDYDSPHAALSDFLKPVGDGTGGEVFQWVNDEPDDRERRVAVQDAKCKAEVGFWDAVDAAEYEAEASLVAERLPSLERMRADYDRKVAHAERILASLAGK
jgi:hypothetical protein